MHAGLGIISYLIKYHNQKSTHMLQTVTEFIKIPMVNKLKQRFVIINGLN